MLFNQTGVLTSMVEVDRVASRAISEVDRVAPRAMEVVGLAENGARQRWTGRDGRAGSPALHWKPGPPRLAKPDFLRDNPLRVD
jgi:hypothetical protein